MLRKIITATAIILLAAAIVSCDPGEGTAVPQGVKYLGKITAPALRECSGIAMSHRYPGVFWTHNDSNNPEVLYAITQNGTLLGQWHVVGRPLADWEDITFDNDGNLLLADIGDNPGWRRRIAVHRLKEPDPTRGNGTVEIDQSYFLAYPQGPRNAEAIFVLGPHGYIITKSRSGIAEVYRFPLSITTNTITLEPFATINLGSRVTSAALSPHTDVLAMTTSAGAYGWRINGDISRLNGTKPQHLTQFKNRKIEGCTFVPEGLMAVSEKRHLYLFTNDFFRPTQFHSRAP